MTIHPSDASGQEGLPPVQSHDTTGDADSMLPRCDLPPTERRRGPWIVVSLLLVVGLFTAALCSTIGLTCGGSLPARGTCGPSRRRSCRRRRRAKTGRIAVSGPFGSGCRPSFSTMWRSRGTLTQGSLAFAISRVRSLSWFPWTPSMLSNAGRASGKTMRCLRRERGFPSRSCVWPPIRPAPTISRWSMTPREVRWLRCRLAMRFPLALMAGTRAEYLSGDELEGIANFAADGGSVLFDWETPDERFRASVVFADHGGPIDPTWVRSVCQSLRFSEDGLAEPTPTDDQGWFALFEVNRTPMEDDGGDAR